MGCWNGTCMISNLPILSGEKVKLVFLTKNFEKPEILNSSGFCYSHDLLTPAFLPISGEYDDYGGIENITKDFNYKIIEEFFKRIFPSKIKNCDDECENWDLETIIHYIERGVCKFLDKNDTWKDFDFSWVFIREDIYQSIVKLNRNLKIYDYDINKYVKIDTLFDKNVETYRNNKTNEDSELSETEKMIRDFRFDFSFKSIFRKDSGRNYFKTFIEYECFMKLNFDKTKEINKIKKVWKEFYLFENFLENSRKSWMIQSGAGSQNDDWDIMKKFSQKIIDICDKKIAEDKLNGY